ncbi:TPA: hypothetical protein QCV70_002479 [Bacillus cereus]|nr:hypothetical protein [Bacillus cereus]
MAGKKDLTAKQEAFAFSVAIEHMGYTEAYKKHYSTKNMKERTVWVEASKLANSPNISLRIAELREQAQKSKFAEMTWDFKQSEQALILALELNKSQLIRDDEAGRTAKYSNNTAYLGAVKQLTDLTTQVQPPPENSLDLTEYEDNGLIEALNGNHGDLWDEEDDKQ